MILGHEVEINAKYLYSQNFFVCEIAQQYCDNSKYYCFTYKMTMNEIIFDDREKLDNRDKVNYFLVQIAMRIMSYMENSQYQYDHDNPIIRIADDASVLESKIINIEEITLEMIK